MRSAVVGLAALLCACAAAQSPIRGDAPGHSCRIEGTDRFIDQTRSESIGAAIREVSRAAVLRWAPTGVMLTMDFREDRVTVYLGPDGRITKVACG